jgi:DNA-binding IclR family transcriptional regulator
MDGPTEEHLMQDTRATIARFLREHSDGRKPKDIAEALRLNPNTVRQTCRRMAEDGQLRDTNGTYYPPTQISDRCDTPTVSHLSLRHSTPPEQGEHQ